MGTEHDGHGDAVLFRPLFVELSEQQIEMIQEAQESADEEAFVTAAVEQVRREGEIHFLKHQLLLVRAWFVQRAATGKDLSRLCAWLRVLVRDQELHGSPAWTHDRITVDLWPARCHHPSDVGKAPCDVLTRFDGPLGPA